MRTTRRLPSDDRRALVMAVRQRIQSADRELDALTKRLYPVGITLRVTTPHISITARVEEHLYSAGRIRVRNQSTLKLSEWSVDDSAIWVDVIDEGGRP